MANETVNLTENIETPEAKDVATATAPSAPAAPKTSGSHSDKTPGDLLSVVKENPIIFAGAGVVVVIVIAFVLLLTAGNLFHVADALSSHGSTIKSTELYSATTVKELGDNKDAFAVGDPIMAKFEYKDVTDGTILDFTVTKKSDDSVVRKGSIPVSASAEGEGSGERYISIVSSARTSLEAGTYVFKLTNSADDSQVIAQYTFKIK